MIWGIWSTDICNLISGSLISTNYRNVAVANSDFFYGVGDLLAVSIFI